MGLDHARHERSAWPGGSRLAIGLLDRLPPEIAHAVVACAEDGLGWAILMRDVGPDLIPPGDNPIGVRENTYFLAAMAALHVTFWEDPGAADLRLGFCNLRHRYAELSPETGRRETGGPDSVPRLILEGWDLLRMMVEPDVAGILSELLEDPRPMCEALDRYPQTVVHGDWKLGNLGLLRGRQPRVILGLSCWIGR